MAAARPQMALPRVIHRKSGESQSIASTAVASCAFCAATKRSNRARTSPCKSAAQDPVETNVAAMPRTKADRLSVFVIVASPAEIAHYALLGGPETRPNHSNQRQTESKDLNRH